MLAVVENHERWSRLQERDDGGEWIADAAAEPKGRSDDTDDCRRIGHWGQAHHRDVASAPVAVGDLEGEAGLPDTAGSDERDEALRLGEAGDAGQLGATTDER